MVDEQDNNSTNHGNQQAVQVQSIHPAGAEQAEQETADYSSNDTEYDVEQNAFSRPVHQLAADEASDESENDPGDDGHETLLQVIGIGRNKVVESASSTGVPVWTDMVWTVANLIFRGMSAVDIEASILGCVVTILVVAARIPVKLL